MTWRVLLSSLARDDLEQALDRTSAQFGVRQHDDYADLIRLAISEMAEDPHGFRSKPRPELQPGTRTLHIGRPGRRARHLFVYHVVSAGVINVDRFLHDAMDLGRHLSTSDEGESK